MSIIIVFNHQFMNNWLKIIFKNLWLFQLFVFFLVLMVFLLRLNKFPPQIPLFFSKIEGNEQIADSYLIFLPIFFSFFFISLNFFVQNFLFKENIFLKKLTFFVNLIIIFISTFIFLKILFLVT